MFKHLILTLSILVSAQLAKSQSAFQAEEYTCHQFAAEIRQLNEDAGFSYYTALELLWENGKPVSGCNLTRFIDIELKLKVTKQTTLFETYSRVNLAQELILKLSKSGSLYCEFEKTSGDLVLKNDSSSNYIVTGKLRCTSRDNLEVLKNLDVEELLNQSTEGLDLEFNLIPNPAPVGTTIHN